MQLDLQQMQQQLPAFWSVCMLQVRSVTQHVLQKSMMPCGALQVPAAANSSAGLHDSGSHPKGHQMRPRGHAQSLSHTGTVPQQPACLWHYVLDTGLHDGYTDFASLKLTNYASADGLLATHVADLLLIYRVQAMNMQHAT